MRRLIIRPGAIGDFIVSLPAMEVLKTHYTEVWTSGANVPLARFADRARSLYSTGIDTLGLPGVQVPSALGEFDSIVSWYGANRPEFREAVRNLPVQFHEALPPEGALEHATEYYLRQVGAHPGTYPQLRCETTKANFAVIHPFSGGGDRKNWPLARFRELAARLPMPVAWTAGPEEALEGATRFEDLWDLARWLASARLYVGNDSGISHLAAATGTSVVAVFGPTDPKIWSPGGPMVKVVRANDRRLDSVSVEAVFEATGSLLSLPSGR